MRLELKPKKCRLCKAEYRPNTEWQKWCSERCRGRMANRRKLRLIREARKIIRKHELAGEAQGGL